MWATSFAFSEQPNRAQAPPYLRKHMCGTNLLMLILEPRGHPPKLSPYIQHFATRTIMMVSWLLRVTTSIHYLAEHASDEVIAVSYCTWWYRSYIKLVIARMERHNCSPLKLSLQLLVELGAHLRHQHVTILLLVTAQVDSQYKRYCHTCLSVHCNLCILWHFC